MDPNASGKTGFLLLHGIFGSPKEWHQLETQLQAHGHRTRALTQPGHGLKAEMRLKDVSPDVLLSHSMAEYKALAEECDRVILIGHSLGGICTLWLAGQRPEKLAGAVVFSAPYEHAYLVNYTHGLLKLRGSRLIKAVRYAHEVYSGYDFTMFWPWWMPKLKRHARDMFRQLDAHLPQIEVPVFLAHSRHDAIVPYEEMEKIARRINKPHLVQTCTLEACGHQVFTNWRRYEEPYQLVHEFLQALERQNVSI